VARRKQNKKLTLVEFLEKKTVILTALAITSEANLFLQASPDAFDGFFPDSYAPIHFDTAPVDDAQMSAS
jgi:hypothetical protein